MFFSHENRATASRFPRKKNAVNNASLCMQAIRYLKKRKLLEETTTAKEHALDNLNVIMTMLEAAGDQSEVSTSDDVIMTHPITGLRPT